MDTENWVVGLFYLIKLNNDAMASLFSEIFQEIMHFLKKKV